MIRFWFLDGARRELVEVTGIRAGVLEEVSHETMRSPRGFRHPFLGLGVNRDAAAPRPEVRLDRREHSAFRWVFPSEPKRVRMKALNQSVALLARATSTA